MIRSDINEIRSKIEAILSPEKLLSLQAMSEKILQHVATTDCDMEEFFEAESFEKKIIFTCHARRNSRRNSQVHAG